MTPPRKPWPAPDAIDLATRLDIRIINGVVYERCGAWDRRERRWCRTLLPPGKRWCYDHDPAHRCPVIANATGQRCRNWRQHGAGVCAVHHLGPPPWTPSIPELADLISRDRHFVTDAAGRLYVAEGGRYCPARELVNQAVAAALRERGAEWYWRRRLGADVAEWIRLDAPRINHYLSRDQHVGRERGFR